jgi:hypothetical protein
LIRISGAGDKDCLPACLRGQQPDHFLHDEDDGQQQRARDQTQRTWNGSIHAFAIGTLRTGLEPDWAAEEWRTAMSAGSNTIAFGGLHTRSELWTRILCDVGAAQTQKNEGIASAELLKPSQDNVFIMLRVTRASETRRSEEMMAGMVLKIQSPNSDP